MTRKELENAYELNGLTKYKLRNTEDLLRVHEIDYKAVDGYNKLDDLNRAIYEKFIINIFNTCGLDSRLSLVPKGIYWVEDIEYLVKGEPENDYYNIAGQKVYSIDRTGRRIILHQWEDEKYKHHEKTIEKQRYLRFEFERQGKREWLHVIKEGKEWY